MAEVLQQAVEETSRNAIKERNERAAHQPNINLTEDKDEIERVLSGQSDLAFTMSYEALPDFKVTELAALKLEREVADVANETVDKAVADLLERSTRYEVEADRAAGEGDRVTIDYVGRIDGVEFEGGKGEDVQLVIGQSQFIPGLRRGHQGRQGRRGARRQRQVPGGLSAEDARRQGRGVRRQGQGGGKADPARAQRRLRQDAGRGVARQAQGDGGRQDRRRIRQRRPA